MFAFELIIEKGLTEQVFEQKEGSVERWAKDARRVNWSGDENCCILLRSVCDRKFYLANFGLNKRRKGF